jgi:hypothetical protein
MSAPLASQLPTGSSSSRHIPARGEQGPILARHRHFVGGSVHDKHGGPVVLLLALLELRSESTKRREFRGERTSPRYLCQIKSIVRDGDGICCWKNMNINMRSIVPYLA